MEHDTNSQDYIRLRATAKDAPLEPGVYIWRDVDGQIIYVGKARVLRHRLNSYFSGEKDVKTRTLLKRARSIETIIVGNEYEALLLENTLIKQHTPKYNINLKDGKSYPVVRVTNEDFPRVFRTRRIVEDGSRYYGPFPNVPAVDAMLELVEALFPLRKCRTMRKRVAPCMYFHIGRCAAPCCGKISKEEYATHVERVKQLLAGETESLVGDLGRQMAEAAAALRFERAAQLRNAIQAIRDLSATNSVVDFDPDSRDYIAWASEGVLTTFTVFSMRGGKMTGRELYRARSAASELESLESFLAAYYSADRLPPPRIYLAPVDFSGLEEAGAAGTAGAAAADPLAGIRLWFEKELGQTPALLRADERRHEAVLAMAHQNAREDLGKRLKERGAGPALEELAAILSLGSRPDRIEGFDIAQLDGKHTTASLVSFKDGLPDKKNYRHFNIRTVEGRIDDFGAMREAVSRRYGRLIADGGELPDLVLIDGGIGQVNAARGVLDALGLDLDVVGLAKRDEELWLPGATEPIRVSRNSEALKVLQFIRDETHRFATGRNQRLRSKDLALEGLESVEGVGPARAAVLLKEFGSLEAIAAAAAEDIAARCGLSASLSSAVRAAAATALADRAAEAARLSPAAPKRASSVRRTEYRSRRGSAPAASAADLAAEALADYGPDGDGDGEGK
ncbi:MAG: excinuclease ABC subunit C [Treponema sp. GWB1_62_6]|nr:MAG: excinuclease ABC subunit C [Treponema sp. GWB1_62_6]OHE65240.1 MAG: excinuclease ABC subunit C [Treponema sp. GWC1_61_84]HCM26408.1 excinuclease ABC subunit C [Treponema sp.]